MSQPLPSVSANLQTTPLSSLVPIGGVSITILAANTARVGCVIVNPPGGAVPADRLFIKYGTGCTAVVGGYSFFLDPSGVYIMAPGEWVGEFTAILNSAGPIDISVTETM